MRFTLVAAAAATLATTAFAQVSISVPGGSTVWVLGTNVTTVWAQPLLADTDIELLTGANVQAQHVAGTLGKAPKGSKSFKAVLSAKLAPDWYTVRIGDVYSHLFAIQKDKQTTLTVSAPVAPTTAVTTAVTTSLPATTIANSPVNATTTASGLPKATSPNAAASLGGGLIEKSAVMAITAVVMAAFA
ncbi:hypothetical protein EDD11_000334 [Mortierella claussenii]|nr:hypothetical protein EDD11_000334 [Mortierella claussenii]